ncbi:MAG: hypothetical protein GY753_16540 [Gammaproteobacteria bacterium]|nr:hypothetical protein [Gammaproteobacteria bacterium]
MAQNDKPEEMVSPHYIGLEQADEPSTLASEDDSVIPDQDILPLIEDPADDASATAAGAQNGQGTGGGAAFVADPSGILGDDIGHGPYAGGIEIQHQVEFPVERGAQRDGDGNRDSEEEATLEIVDDHVIVSDNLNPADVDIPDIALLHNDILYNGGYSPEVDWEVTSRTDRVDDEFDYTATNGEASADAHVTIEADGAEGTGLYGTAGDDILISGYGWDFLFGSGGDDVLIGGNGLSVLFGDGVPDELAETLPVPLPDLPDDAGSDLFLFDNALTWAESYVMDFDAAEGDILHFDALFDALIEAGEISDGEQELLVQDFDIGIFDGTALTIGNGSGGELGAADDYGVFLAGVDLDADGLAQLISDGNIVVDQS